jgi:hypothetical protein
MRAKCEHSSSTKGTQSKSDQRLPLTVAALAASAKAQPMPAEGYAFKELSEWLLQHTSMDSSGQWCVHDSASVQPGLPAMNKPLNSVSKDQCVAVAKGLVALNHNSLSALITSHPNVDLTRRAVTKFWQSIPQAPNAPAV